MGDVSGILQISGSEDIMLISDAGRIVRMRAEEVRVIHRSTQGVRLIDLDENEKLVGVARAEREEDRENGVAPEDLLEDAGPEQETLPEIGPVEKEGQE
ncbi:MAG: DNA gyrase C-terminal beta-propeller domain-containing protein [Syntrophales bacterium]|nr:DNA gyrase C-terminal beta-propeller domain-containing protein [Syntrophales bacterium]